MIADAPSRRVLVVDDDHETCLLLAEIIRLSVRGAAVATAHDGAEAVRLAVSEPPFAVIVDLEMPVVDGIVAAAEIRRALESSPRLFAVSGNPELLEQATRTGLFDDCFLKPVDIRLLLANLNRG